MHYRDRAGWTVQLVERRHVNPEVTALVSCPLFIHNIYIKKILAEQEYDANMKNEHLYLTSANLIR